MAKIKQMTLQQVSKIFRRGTQGLGEVRGMS